jgi:hypothetical protein
MLKRALVIVALFALIAAMILMQANIITFTIVGLGVISIPFIIIALASLILLWILLIGLMAC